MKLSIPLFLLLFIPSLLWNHQIFLLINGVHTPVTDYFFGHLSGFADGLISIIFIFMLMLYRFRLGLAGLLAFTISGTFAQILKRTFDMPRPPSVFQQVHLLGESLGQHSFPSGHATTAGMMALLAIYVWKAKPALGWSVFTLFLLAAYGRVYGGVHFPLDVVTGFGIGAACMWWSNKVSHNWPVSQWQESEWSWKIPGLLLMISAVSLGTGYHIQPTTASALTLVIPIVALITLIQAWKTRFRA